MIKLLTHALLITGLFVTMHSFAFDTVVIEQFKTAINNGDIAKIKELISEKIDQIKATDLSAVIDYAKQKSPAIAALLEKAEIAKSTGFTGRLERLGLISKSESPELKNKETSNWEEFLANLRGKNASQSPAPAGAPESTTLDTWLEKGKAYWEDLKNKFEQYMKEKEITPSK